MENNGNISKKSTVKEIIKYLVLLVWIWISWNRISGDFISRGAVFGHQDLASNILYFILKSPELILGIASIIYIFKHRETKWWHVLFYILIIFYFIAIIAISNLISAW
jgi:hypothetical protein